jgi:hypothetical protein
MIFRLMMEKFDGVRVYWDGEYLISSYSKAIINVPKEYSFPRIPFEGELWYVMEIFWR